MRFATIRTNLNFPNKDNLIEVCHRMFPDIPSVCQQRYPAKQLEDEKQATLDAKRQAYAQRKEHECSMVLQSLDVERNSLKRVVFIEQ